MHLRNLGSSHPARDHTVGVTDNWYRKGVILALGTIETTDPKPRMLTLAAPQGRYTATVTERACISWLDRSQLKLTALSASYSDL